MRRVVVWIFIISLAGLVTGCGSKAFVLGPEQLQIIEINQEAADGGDCEAMFNIGRAYDNGQGICKSNAKAVQWYKNAAESGSFEAMAWLTDECDIEWVTAEELIIMLEVRGPEKQMKAIKAMGKMRDQRFVEPLVEIVEENDNSEVVKEAIKSLKKVTGENFGKNHEKWSKWAEDQQIQ